MYLPISPRQVTKMRSNGIPSLCRTSGLLIAVQASCSVCGLVRMSANIMSTTKRSPWTFSATCDSEPSKLINSHTFSSIFEPRNVTAMEDRYAAVKTLLDDLSVLREELQTKLPVVVREPTDIKHYKRTLRDVDPVGSIVARRLKARLKQQAAAARRTKALRLGAGAPVYLAAVLQYVVRKVLEPAGHAAREARATRITPRDISKAVKHNPELAAIFSSCPLCGCKQSKERKAWRATS